MNEISFTVQGYYDLLNLHKALLEAKFHKNPDNDFVAGSPIIARLCNEIVDLLTEHKGGWSDWRRIENQSFFIERAIDNAVAFYSNHDNVWEKLKSGEKAEQIKNYLSPFIANERDILIISTEVERRLQLNKDCL